MSKSYENHIPNFHRKIYIPWINHIKWSLLGMNSSTINKIRQWVFSYFRRSELSDRHPQHWSPGPSGCWPLGKWIKKHGYLSVKSCFTQKSKITSLAGPLKLCLFSVASLMSPAHGGLSFYILIVNPWHKVEILKLKLSPHNLLHLPLHSSSKESDFSVALCPAKV